MDAQVWLNADYLTRILKASSGELTIKVGKPQEPVLVKSGDLVALIMPLLCATDPFENETAIPIPFDHAVPGSESDLVYLRVLSVCVHRFLNQDGF